MSLITQKTTTTNTRLYSVQRHQVMAGSYDFSTSLTPLHPSPGRMKFTFVTPLLSFLFCHFRHRGSIQDHITGKYGDGLGTQSPALVPDPEPANYAVWTCRCT